MADDKYLHCAGEFTGEVEMPQGGWFQLSKEKQTPYIAIPIVVTGEDIDAGKRITWAGWLSDKAIDRTVETLVKCFGFDGDLNSLYAGNQTFEGKAVNFTTEIEEYKGKEQCRIKWLNPPGYVHTGPKLDETTAKTLIAGLSKRVKAAAASVKVESPQAGNTPHNRNPVAGPEDDCPF